MSVSGVNNTTKTSEYQGKKAKDVELTVRDGIIDTGRYEIEAKEGEVWIRDRHTNTWVKLWGDPHGVTSDGDKFQFHENVTFELPDGTKISIKTTPKDANGIALMDSIAVMKGTKGVEATGISDGQAGANIGEVTSNVADLEKKYEDGTILTVGENGQIDDLFTSKGEIVGGDKTQKFGEHLVDGLGGKSRFDFSDGDGWQDLIGEGKSGCKPGSDGILSKIKAARSPEELMFLIALMFQDRIQSLTEEMGNVADQLDKEMDTKQQQQAAIDKAKQEGKDPPEFPPSNQKDLETKLATLQFDVQRLQQLSQQFFTAATNTSKSRHDANMAIVGNYK
jgi:hypothetical protein